MFPFGVYFDGEADELPLLFDKDFLELLNPLVFLPNLDTELMFDFTVKWLPWFTVTVLPKSGISKFLS